MDLSIAQPNANFLSKMLNDISARISARASPNELADITSNRRIIWDNGRVIDELRHALEQSRTRYCVFVDGVDEIEPLTPDTFLRAFRGLKGTLRFIFAGRANPFFHRLDAQVPPPQILMLGHLPRDDVITLVNNTLRPRGLSVDERSLEAILERSEGGNPFVVSLMAEALKEGHTLEELMQHANTKYVLDRVIGPLVAGGVPDEVLRALTSLLLKKRDIMWEELQRELNASDSIMQALMQAVQSTSFFLLEPAGEHHMIRVHDVVLDGLRRHYRLTDEGAHRD